MARRQTEKTATPPPPPECGSRCGYCRVSNPPDIGDTPIIALCPCMTCHQRGRR